jgi:MoxR-like ATPase
MGKNSLIYKGEALTTLQTVKDEERLQVYLPEKSLIDAVNLSIFLQRPLLIMGEPGSGKTRLAEAVAYEFYKEAYNEYYFRWDIKSISKAQDGLYRYDALERLRDAHLKKASLEKRDYIKEGELWKAFEKSTPEKPTILLIDEIDKADIDFPNDLLLELDKNEFVIEETGERVSAKYPPIIFINSNNEKELPPAFLRRCLFHYIEFPKEKHLHRIIWGNFDEPSVKVDRQLVEKAVKTFLLIREKMEEILTVTDKKVSTSELIDWFKVINYYYYQGIKIDGNINIDTALERTLQELQETGKSAIPFHQVLLKNWETHINLLSKIDEL